MANGYNGKILVVDLTTGSHEVREPEERWYRTYWGGTGIIAETLLNEIDPDFFAVDVPVEIEDMHLHGKQLTIESGAVSDIGNTF